MYIFKLLLIGSILLCTNFLSSDARARRPYVERVRVFGEKLVKAIHTNDWQLAKRLIPNTLEALSLPGLSTANAHRRFVEQRKKGFARVVAKFARKACKTVSFSRFKYSKKVTKYGRTMYKSVDVFALCDGREVWVADPDFVFKLRGMWRLLEFD